MNEELDKALDQMMEDLDWEASMERAEHDSQQD